MQDDIGLLFDFRALSNHFCYLLFEIFLLSDAIYNIYYVFFKSKNLEKTKKLFYPLQMTRNILGTEPRVTRFKINWDDSEQPTTSNGIQTTCHENEDSNLQEMDEDRSCRVQIFF